MREANRTPQRGAVVEDDIDADELLQNSQTDTHPDDWPDTACGSAQICEARLGLGGYRAANQRDRAFVLCRIDLAHALDSRVAYSELADPLSELPP